MRQHNGDWACGPLMKVCSICSIRTQVSEATFLEKSQVAHSLAFNKAFNATDSLFDSPVCEAACCFFRSLLVLQVNGYYGWTNKEKVDDYRRGNLKVKLRWGQKTDLQLPIIARGAVKDFKMKIFEMLTLLLWYWVQIDYPNLHVVLESGSSVNP